MRILVTGGAGYIGSHVAALLHERGDTVRVVDDLSKGHVEAVKGPGLIRADLRRPQELEAAFSGGPWDAVIHLAASSLVGESMEAPARYYENNVVGGFHLVEAMRRHGVTRLVFSSTAAVYGEPERVPIVEEEPPRPTNPYGATKLAFEEMLHWYGEAYGLRSVSLRYFNVAGADPDRGLGEDHHPETHLIPILLEVALGQRERFQVFGDDYPTADGTCIRDYIHVLDLAEAHLLALDHLARGGASRTYNLGNGAGFSVREVCEAARRVIGRPIPTVVGPRRPGDPPVLVASSERIRAELGWVPRRPSVEEMIESAWHWRLAHPDGFPAKGRGEPGKAPQGAAEPPRAPSPSGADHLADPPLPPRLTRSQERKADGRYLVYYGFPGESAWEEGARAGGRPVDSATPGASPSGEDESCV
ncbi:UDP-glucose 4-epimerase [Limnochorda pilosa]|uniref:UDP-glucose 4-epimerase n=1 Tax=Limnochorda pilosa TaxID=1555112 RepID=A0A0K2SIX7_LIMPI|nr:UDP-glucose 4-epimerase GalE [Limnochorda pilosa]BAS27045.1 UDP-glucose 4-epimerase [Limnochorda pilosa]